MRRVMGGVRRVMVQRLARFSDRFTHALAPLSAAEPAIDKAINSCLPAGEPERRVSAREGQTTLGAARRAYSTAVNSAAYNARNYANNIYEYNKVLQDINYKKRAYLMRDVYEDMQMDGVQPIRDTFHTLITGCMKGERLQDVMYFFDEMKAMGLAPDIVLYNCVIASCGRANQTDRAFQVAEEMEACGIQPKHRTFLALLNACGTAGRVEEAYGVVRRMAACGLTLNSSCYSALITAHKNSRPVTQETFLKIFELLEQSKGCEAGPGEGEGRDDFEEELANLVTGGALQPTRSYVNRRLNVYYSALRACGDLGNIEAVGRIIAILEQDGHQIDATCITELVKSYIGHGDLQNAVNVVDRYIEAGKNPSLGLYITLIQSCLQNLNPFSSAAAKRLLQQMDERGYFLNTSIGSVFLTLASAEMDGDYSTANTIWDMMHKRNLKPSIRAVTSFCNGLQRRKVPEGDMRLAVARDILEKVQKQNNWGGRGAPTEMQQGADQEQESAEEALEAANEDDAAAVQDPVAEEHGDEQANEHVAATT